MTDSAVEHYLGQIAAHPASANAAWLGPLQDAATESLRQAGFPTRRQEEWKYTDVKPILRRDFTLSVQAREDTDPALIEAARISGLDCHVLMFINGVYAPEHSHLQGLDDGLVVKPLSLALREDEAAIKAHLNQRLDTGRNGFLALNTAMAQEGAAILIADQAVLDKPINIIYLSDNGSAANLRNLVVLGQNSAASIIETYYGTGDAEYFNNTITEVSLQAGARLQQYRLQQEGLGGFHVGFQKVHQERDSRFECLSIALGGQLARTDLEVDLASPGASCELNGLYMAGGTQHVDNHTRVNHIAPHTSSNETYRGVLGDRARGVFNGKIVVSQDAQKTDAHLSNANLLLSSEAEVDTKPELEIYADDVKCSHGATVGQLDENMMFYLRTRAIEEDVARSLLTFAFAEDVINRIHYPQIKSRLENNVVARLPDAELIREFVK